EAVERYDGYLHLQRLCAGEYERRASGYRVSGHDRHVQRQMALCRADGGIVHREPVPSLGPRGKHLSAGWLRFESMHLKPKPVQRVTVDADIGAYVQSNGLFRIAQDAWQQVNLRFQRP